MRQHLETTSTSIEPGEGPNVRRVLDSILQQHFKSELDLDLDVEREQLLAALSDQLVRVYNDGSSLAQHVIDAAEELPDGLIVWDAEGCFLFCNSRHREYHPYTNDEEAYVRGKPFAEILRARIASGEYGHLSGDQEAWYQNRLDQWERLGEPGTSNLSRNYEMPDGRWIACRAIRLKSGHTFGISIDISERRLREMEFVESKANLRLIADASPVAILIGSTKTGKVLFCNPKAEELFGYSREDLIGRRAETLYYSPATRPKTLALAGSQGGLRNHELKLRHADGSPIWGLASVELLIYAGESASLAVISDITNKRKNNDVLRRRNQELTTLHSLANIALSARSLRQACQEMVETISLSTGFPHVAIEIFDTAYPRITGDPLASDKAEAIAGFVARTGSVTPRVRSSELSPYDTRPHTASGPYETQVSVPIVSGDHSLGTLTLAHPEPEAFATHLPWWADTLANTLANLIRKITWEEQGALAQRRYRLLMKRVQLSGARSLSDVELMESLLLTPQPLGDASETAAHVLACMGGFSGHREHLCERGDEQIADYIPLFAVVREISERAGREKFHNRPVLSAWDDLVAHCQSTLGSSRTEQVRGLFLNTTNMLISDELLGEGGPKSVQISSRTVAKRALELDATALVLVHNHPSGDPTPSTADIQFTVRLRDALESLGVTLHDHLIVCHSGVVSFRDLRLL